jgi:hypothetical protein
MNKKMYNIAFGERFVRELLLLRQLRRDIETKTSDEISENEREYLLLKLEEGKVFPGHHTQINILRMLQISPDSLSELAHELQSIKGQIDLHEDSDGKLSDVRSRSAEASNLGSYFFISAVIALSDLSILSVKEGEVDKELLKKLYPLVESAKRFSKELRLRPPNITEQALMHGNIEAIQDSLRRWRSSLTRSAVREPSCENRPKLVFRGLLRGIPYFGPAVDALVFGRE